MKRAIQLAPPPDLEAVVTDALSKLIHEALTEAARPTHGFSYTEGKNTQEAAKERARKLRGLRDAFELAMSGVDLVNL